MSLDVAGRNYRNFLADLVARLWCPEKMIGAEIGVGCGGTSKLLLEKFPNLTLWMVDTWRRFDPKSPYRETGDRRSKLSDSDQEARFQATIEATKFAEDRAVPVRLSSSEAAKIAKSQRCLFNFVFIDGDHSYDGVYKDLCDWWPLVSGFSSSLFCGHDYGHHKYHGVKKAVDQFFSEKNLKFQTGVHPNESVWFFYKEA